MNCTEKAKNRQPWADGGSGELLEKHTTIVLPFVHAMLLLDESKFPNISRNANPELCVMSIKLLLRLLGC